MPKIQPILTRSSSIKKTPKPITKTTTTKSKTVTTKKAKTAKSTAAAKDVKKDKVKPVVAPKGKS